MSENGTEIVVLAFDGELPVVRVHLGTLAAGTRIVIATDPHGQEHAVDLTVTEIQRYPGVMVQELEPPHVGVITFGGQTDMLAVGWVLKGP